MRKFALKAMVASVALASSSAFAYGAGDLFVEVQDLTAAAAGATTATTFILDTGVQAGSSLTSQSINLGSAFTTWLATQSTTDTLSFMLVGGGSTTNGILGYDATQGTPTGISTQNYNYIFTPGTGAVGVIETALGPTGTTATVAVNQPATIAIEDGTTNALFNIVPANTYANANTANSLTLGLFGYNGLGTGTFANLGTATLTTATATLQLTTTAVPEPGSYALMVAGLLAVGAIARRRSRT